MNSVATLQPYFASSANPNGLHRCNIACGCGSSKSTSPAFKSNVITITPADSLDKASKTEKKQPAFLTGITVEELTSGKLSLSKRLGLGLIAGYQWITRKISPNGDIQNKFFTCNCSPSCSVYTAESIKQHGLFKGSYMGLKQIVTKCYPFQPVMVEHGFKKGIPMVLKAIAYEFGLAITKPDYKEAYDKVKSALGRPGDKA